MSEDLLVVILTLAPVFVIISLVSFQIISMTRLRALWPLINVLLIPGIVVHEAGHYIMCRSLGVKVNKVHLLKFEKKRFTGSIEAAEVQNTFLKPFLIAIAPSLINTIFVCLLILVAPFFAESWINLLLGWFAVALVLECGPSSADLAHALRPIVKYPRSTLRELGFLALGIVCGIVLYRVCLLTIGVDLPPLVVAIFSILTVVILFVAVGQN